MSSVRTADIISMGFITENITSIKDQHSLYSVSIVVQDN